jgi:ferredoxin
MGLRIHVNPIACDAHGICVELLPEVFRLDDWGYPVIDVAVIPSELESLAGKTADACPTLAVMIEDTGAVG